MTVRDIYRLLNAVAPFETQEPWDNSGLLVGSPEQEVSGILFALDCTDAVIAEALTLQANLIITHHPLMFSARKKITDEDYEGRILTRLIRNSLSLIASHTCLDRAPGGINDALAEVLALLDVRGEGFVRVGRLPVPMTSGSLKEYLSAALGGEVRLMGSAETEVTWVGLCSGAGGDEWTLARELGAQAFVSGEIKHHLALEMADVGIPAFECGHFATEQPGIFALADALQSALNQVKYKLGIYKSATGAYPLPKRCGMPGSGCEPGAISDV